MTASTAAEPFAPGDWVVVGENATNTPHGVARVTTITENGSLIVAVGHMQHKHVVGARYCQRHAGPPPGREPAPPARPRPAAPAPVARHPWRPGDRVMIARDQRDGPGAGTPGAIFGAATIPGYWQIKTAQGLVVISADDLERAIPQGPHRGEREAAVRAAQPQPEPSRLRRAIQERRREANEMAAPRGPMSEEHKQAVRDGKARKKAEREALAGVAVEGSTGPGGAPAAPAPALRVVSPQRAGEPPEQPDPGPVARPRFTPGLAEAPPEQPRPATGPARTVGVQDALRWTIGQGATQHLSVTALRLMIDTLEVVEREVREARER